MQVVLLERVGKLGGIGDLVKVKPGYARNFLLPFKKAVVATKTNVEQIAARKAQLETDNAAKRVAAEQLAKKIDGLVVVLLRQAGEGGQLFGSVSAKDVADALVAKSYAVTRQQVLVSKPVKALGIAPFVVQLHPEVRVTVNVNVAMSTEEAASQEKAWKEAAAA